MKRSFPKPSPSTAVILLLPLFLLILIVLVLYPHESELQSLVTACQPSVRASFIDSATPKPSFWLFIGILTLPDHYERRHLLRLVYSLQPKLITAHVDIRFVFCNLTNDDQHVLIALEIMRYDDIIFLDCAESMDNGKTYTYFSSLSKLLNGTNDAGGGRRRSIFILGSQNRVEPKDIVMAGWLKDGERGNNMFNEKPAMYNYPKERLNPWMHEFMPETVAVHQLKDNSRWARTLRYFNVTHALKPSKLYHIP